MSKLIFSTPSPFNPNFALSFGVSAKESSSAIGQFGTGLKYAIAVTLRLGGTISIQQGREKWSFLTKEESFRGKKFHFIHQVHSTNSPDFSTPLSSAPQNLSFTTEYGKHWEPWMAYRELMSNTLDEGGVLLHAGSCPNPDWCNITVECEEIYQASTKHNSIFCSGELLFSTSKLSILPYNGTPALYLKGVQVAQLRHQPPFTFNFSALPLTEDRTLSSLGLYLGQGQLTEAIGELCQSWVLEEREEKKQRLEELLLALLTLPETEFGGLPDLSDISTSHRGALKVFLLSHTNQPKLSQKLFNACLSSGLLDYSSWQPTPADHQRLRTVLAFFASSSFPITPPIQFKQLPSNILGMAKGNVILLSPLAFKGGTRTLAKTLFEEFIHITKQVDDGYPIQHEYLDTIINLLEEKTKQLL